MGQQLQVMFTSVIRTGENVNCGMVVDVRQAGLCISITTDPGFLCTKQFLEFSSEKEKRSVQWVAALCTETPCWWDTSTVLHFLQWSTRSPDLNPVEHLLRCGRTCNSQQCIWNIYRDCVIQWCQHGAES